MFKKLLLAITITFSLNLCLETRQQERTNTDTSFQQKAQVEKTSTILVSVPQNKK